eukprot:CAMPEP_0167781186 /NCGR_PEP_ID=MMETSP0111_2-20121227/5791_1 /TAXON_ID=91324 /ORGANISM="Lotharella globosa, Strain CCCM811" /LENGTH=101 /DNA_ID=CAMNT_0007671817 /DNA_START=348 /DNA_END=654 /DNA_ORIENTATION=-
MAKLRGGQRRGFQRERGQHTFRDKGGRTEVSRNRRRRSSLASMNDGSYDARDLGNGVDEGSGLEGAAGGGGGGPSFVLERRDQEVPAEQQHAEGQEEEEEA